MCSLLHFSYPLQPALEKDKWLWVWLKLLHNIKANGLLISTWNSSLFFYYFLMKTACISWSSALLHLQAHTNQMNALFAICTQISLLHDLSSQITFESYGGNRALYDCFRAFPIQEWLWPCLCPTLCPASCPGAHITQGWDSRTFIPRCLPA